MKKALVLFIMFVFASAAYADKPKFLEHRYEYKLEDVLKADKYEKKDRYWEAYIAGKLVGYIFLSKDWTAQHVGYSGKHMETLVGFDTKGAITGVKIVFHAEPIVLIGLKQDNYDNFIKQYIGKSVLQGMSVGNEIKMDAITGATVTAVVQNAIIAEGAKKVAASAGLIKYAAQQSHKISQKFEPLSWKELMDTGAMKNILITKEDVGQQGGKDPYIDLSFGLATPPAIGKNALGERTYAQLLQSLKEGDSAVFIFSNGPGSFKGSGFARGGVFERFHVEQDDRTYVFTDKDYIMFTELAANGAPTIKEGGIFIIRAKDFDQSKPFKLKLIISYRIGVDSKFKAAASDYKLPDKFMEQ
ncbi:MAG: FMN-binding protein [Candidatus Magnetominusculus sp. LBB02]|nr:FMN-binding protein [Candidatus Magnetominusculus sp. LBB02]